MNALTAKPGRLVESVRRPAREPEDTDDREPGALRRRTPGRQVEEHGLVRAKLAPAKDERADPGAEPADARRFLRLDERTFGRADVRKEDAVLERVQATASPPPAGDGERARHTGAGERRQRGRRREAHDVGRRQPGAQRGCVHRGTDQGITRPFSCASFEGPMPGTPSSSSMLRNGPCGRFLVSRPQLECIVTGHLRLAQRSPRVALTTGGVRQERELHV